MNNKNAYIIGAGITGLAAGYKLSEEGYKVSVFEKEKQVGGMAITFRYKNYSLDLGPHKIFTNLDNIMDEIEKLFKVDPLLKIPKKSRMVLNNKYINYPLGIKDAFLGLGLFSGFACGFSYLFSLAKGKFAKDLPVTYSDWITGKFGNKLYNLVFAPYASKIWGDPKTLDKCLAETRVAAPSLVEVVKQMIFAKKNGKVISAPEFHYPKNGIIELSYKMRDLIRSNKGRVYTEKDLVRVKYVHDTVSGLVFSDGAEVKVNSDDVVISTIPFWELIKISGNNRVRSALPYALKMKSRNLALLYFLVNKPLLSDDNWLFFPENKFLFNRVFEQKNFSPFMVNGGKTVLCAEITSDEGCDLLKKDPDELFKEVGEELSAIGYLNKLDIEEFFVKRIDRAYPVYDLSFKKNKAKVFSVLDSISNLYSVGRMGGFNYIGMADAMDVGFSTSKFIIENNVKSDFIKYRELFDNYVVVD